MSQHGLGNLNRFELKTRVRVGHRRWVIAAAFLLVALTLSVSAVQQLGQSKNPQTGSRGAEVKPKRSVKRKSGKVTNSLLSAPGTDAATAIIETTSPVLATADFDLLGLAVIASPSSLTVPKNTPTIIQTGVRVPDGTDPSSIIAGLNPNFRVRGELSGPSLTTPLTLEAPIGQPLNVPALTNAGDHMVRNLRVVDISTPDQSIVTPVTPDSVGIVVIESLLVSQVQVHELTYDEIVQAGINISGDSYTAFNFTLGIATTSIAQFINIPVAFPKVGVSDPRPIVGTTSVSSPGIDAPTVVPIMLTVETPDGKPSGQPPIDDGGGPVRIPGVIVFPGRVGFLHQFFEAIVIVGNGAPNGAPLVIHSLVAKAHLPDGGTPADSSDDPLRIAETQIGGRVSELELHGLGPDNKYGTGDDTTSFGPGESGQASFLLEGLKEGLHDINFDLEATLEGLPSGPAKVHGQVSGAVLVRDASFSVTFTHPSVVRAGNQYDLGMTVYNSGQRNIQGAFAHLNANSISGAELVGQDNGQRQFATTIKPGESATIKWRLRSDVTGEVSATYVKVGDDISAGLDLVTGVGDRNIPLSPDSLILPDPVRHLPSDVVEAGRALLGQAWSIANAPPGSLPQGVTKLTKQTVVDRAVELGIAGMRVDFGEQTNVSLDTIMRDWLGELQSSPDPGFADAQRNTLAGYNWFDSIGSEFNKSLTGGASVSAVDLHKQFANTEMPRSRFISALVTQQSGNAILGARFVDSKGKRVGFGATPDARDGDLAQGSSISLAQTDAISNTVSNAGQMLVVSNAATDNWTLELYGWGNGSVDISLLAPATSQVYTQYVWSGVSITQGGSYRVKFKPLSLTALPVLEEFKNGTWQATATTPAATTLNQPGPAVTGVIQVTPDVVAGGDKYGRLVGILFSKPMLQDQAQNVSRYRIGGGALKGSSPSQQVGDPISVTGAKMDYGNRFVFLGLNSTIGPYIDRDLTITSLQDSQRLPLSPAPVTSAIQPRVSPQGIPPGAYLTGRVLDPNGNPVVNAPVTIKVQECPDPLSLAPPPPTPVALKNTDAQGHYEFDFVRDSDCAPMSVSVRNPTTLSEKQLSSAVAYDGQHLVVDIVFLARGNVEGNITSGGQAMPKAFVRVVPELDAQAAKVVQADQNGHYVVTDIPVGNVAVLAVGDGAAHNASGFAAGTIKGSGQTALINVSLQNVAGIVQGHVFHANQTPSAGSLVVAYATIPGFISTRIDGGTAVGYSVSDRDGSFSISNLPVGLIKLEITDSLTGSVVQQSVQLTNSAPEVDGIVITLLGSGAVSGRVTDDTGSGLSNVIVTSAGSAVQTDSTGNYTLPGLPPGMNAIEAIDPVTSRTGSTQAQVIEDQTTSSIDIVIQRPSTLEGTVSVIAEGTSTAKPAAGINVTADGVDIVETDAQGHYTIQNVQPGARLLRFVDLVKGNAINTNVTLLPGETLTRDAVFQPGSVHGKVFQPDGVTPTVAHLSVYTPLVHLLPGPDWGSLRSDQPLLTQSAADGSYSISGANPGKYRVSASNEFFPVSVSDGGTLAAGGNVETNLILVNNLAGKIQGRVFQSDGTTSVGQGIRVTLSGGSLADATVRTDESGHYEFAEVFSAGSYSLTATDPASGNTNRISVSVEKNKDAVFDLRLLGIGNLRVSVVDGAGQPVQSGTVTIDGDSYPNAHRFADVSSGNTGVASFDNLPEGSYAVSASRLGLGGRVSAKVANGSTVDITVQLQSTGNVEGHVYLPDGTTAVTLADVHLSIGTRSAGFVVSSEEPDPGKFTFSNVPTGDFTLDVFDNHTGRVGRATGTVSQQGQSVVSNVLLLPIGAVTGHVTSNGTGVDHAAIHITADGSGVRGADLFATTDPDGHYRFTGIPFGRFIVSVTNSPNGQTGSVSGTVSGTGEPLPDTIADIVLEPSQTVTGTVYQQGGTSVLAGAQVTITVGGRQYQSSTNDHGIYSLGFVPLGEVRVRADAPVGYNRGEAAPVTGTQAGGTLTVNVTLAGVGVIAGDALDNSGAPLSAGTVTFTNSDWAATPVVLFASVQSNGHYELTGMPAGHYSLRLTAPGRVGVGVAAGEIVGGQTVNQTLHLEDAGTITGVVKSADGGALVQGAAVTVTLTRAGATLSFLAHTDAQGSWTLGNVPLGNLDISVTDQVSGGIARMRNVALSTNEQVVDVGIMLLDSTPISVVSVSPTDGATGVPTNGAVVTITFSEPAESSTVNLTTVRLLQGSVSLGTTVTLSGEGRVAALTPTSRLAENSIFTVAVNDIEDHTGLRLAGTFNSSFTTADESAPIVASVDPPNAATEVAADAVVRIEFNEPIDREVNLQNVIKVVPDDSGNVPVNGIYELAADGRSVTFKPAGALSGSSRYTVNVNGQRDLSGNIQTQAFVSTFTTHDSIPPVIDPLPIDGTTVHTVRPQITATYNDALTGINTGSIVLKVDNVVVTAGAIATVSQLTYTPQAALAVGPHNVSLIVVDNAGNVSEARTASFMIDNTGPAVSSFTIAGKPAVDGLTLSNSPRPIFSAAFFDEAGIDTAQTRLLLSKQGEVPQQVSATVTQGTLSYQPDQDLSSGSYLVQLIVVDSLGNQTSSAVLRFTLSQQSSEILSILPSTGSTLGGTLATITGNFLVDSPVPPAADARGLSGEYYQDAPINDPQRPVGLRLTRIDPAIDFEWASEPPSSYIDPFAFSVKWHGQIQPRYSEVYTFHSSTDGDVNLWINGQQITPHNVENADVDPQSSIALVAGERYDIRLEYKALSTVVGPRSLHLLWSSPSQAQEVIPSSQLFPSAQPVYPNVLIGGQQAKVLGAISDSPNQIACEIPPNAAGPADVTVQTGERSATLSGGFTYTSDTQGPRAIAFSIRYGAIEVPSTTPLRFTFDEPLDPTQDFSSEVTLASRTTGQTFSGNVSLDETRRVVTFTPTVPLAGDDTYAFRISGVRDLAGNSGFGETSFATTDTSAPQISDVSPENIQIASTTPAINVYFFDAASGVDPATVKLIVDDVDVSSRTVSNSSSATYLPSTPMSLGLHTVKVSVSDRVGHQSETRAFSFTVVLSVPTIQTFTISDVNAVGGAKIRTTQPAIFVRFTDPYGINVQATKLFFGRRNTVLTPLPFNSNFSNFTGFYSINYFFSQPLDLGLYTVRFEATNQLGNTVTRSVDFELVDPTPPQVIDEFPAPGAIQVPTNTSVTFTFDKELDPTQDFNSEFVLAESADPNQIPVAGTLSLDPTHRVLKFTPTAALHDSTPYLARIFGFRDLVGNQNFWGSYTNFATVDHVPPVLDGLQISGQQADGLHITLRRPNIVGAYSDGASGVDGSSAVFTIDGVIAIIGIYSDNFQSSFVPPSPLAPGPHTVSLRVSDVAGNVSAIQSATFIVDDTLSITSVSPTHGFTNGGRGLTISGSGLINSDGSRPIVRFGSVQVSNDNDYSVADDFGSAIWFSRVPPGQQGSVDVIVETDHGTATLPNGYTYDDTVAINSVTPNRGFTYGGDPLTITGLGLINSDGTRPVVKFGTSVVQDENGYVVNGDFGDEIVIDQMPAGPAGTVDVVVQTDHGTATLTNGYTFVRDPKTPFAVEADTSLLWHLETFDGFECRFVTDSGPNNISSSCNSRGQLTRGRFSQGLADAFLPVAVDSGSFAFGSSSFTLESWIKLNFDPNSPPPVPLDIFSRADFRGLSNDYSLSVLPSGDVSATLVNSNGDLWQTTMPVAVLNVGDNQWHSIAMVVERGSDPAQNRLIIYIDGEVRASSIAPANFGAIRDSGGTLLVTSTSAGFSGVLDDVRVSTTAHSADQILRTFQGDTLGFVITRFGPGVLSRGETNEVTVDGYNLDSLSAALVTQDGSPLAATFTTLDVKPTTVRFGISVDQSVPLGPAVLNIASGGQTIAQPVRIVEQHPFTASSGTVLLWHLDEASFNTILDSSASGISGSGQNAIPGRFGNGRNGVVAFSVNSKLSFGATPFSVSFWLKAHGSSEDFDLLKLENGSTTLNLFDIRLLHSGAVSAVLQDLQGNNWQAATPIQSERIANDQWRLITVVAERGDQTGQNNLRIYVDGVERISAPAPAGFGALPAAGGIFLVGGNNPDSPPVDEIRLLNYALTPVQIAEEWFGPGQSASAEKTRPASQDALNFLKRDGSQLHEHARLVPRPPDPDSSSGASKSQAGSSLRSTGSFTGGQR